MIRIICIGNRFAYPDNFGILIYEELKKASALHAKYSVSQYKNVLKTLNELEKEKEFLEEKVKQRTSHLEIEIEQKQELTYKLEKVAKYDQLTGLANRYLFLNELEIIQKESDLLNHQFALLFIDLDGFKLVNDTYAINISVKLLSDYDLIKKLKELDKKYIYDKNRIFFMVNKFT